MYHKEEKQMVHLQKMQSFKKKKTYIVSVVLDVCNVDW